VASRHAGSAEFWLSRFLPPHGSRWCDAPSHDSQVWHYAARVLALSSEACPANTPTCTDDRTYTCSPVWRAIRSSNCSLAHDAFGQVEALADAFSGITTLAALPWPARLRLFQSLQLRAIPPATSSPAVRALCAPDPGLGSSVNVSSDRSVATGTTTGMADEEPRSKGATASNSGTLVWGIPLGHVVFTLLADEKVGGRRDQPAGIRASQAAKNSSEEQSDGCVPGVTIAGGLSSGAATGSANASYVAGENGQLAGAFGLSPGGSLLFSQQQQGLTPSTLTTASNVVPTQPWPCSISGGGSGLKGAACSLAGPGRASKAVQARAPEAFQGGAKAPQPSQQPSPTKPGPDDEGMARSCILRLVS
jgi:hypothetical protein